MNYFLTSGMPLAATMKSKKDTSPAAAPGEFGCTYIECTRRGQIDVD
jgi:hypothetical protein